MAEEKAVSKEMADKLFEAVEVAKATGKVKKGTNEVTKELERGNAKLVLIAEDVTPPEVVMHLPMLAKEKGITCLKAGKKEELGAAAGLDVGTSSIAIVQPGEASSLLKQINDSLKKG